MSIDKNYPILKFETQEDFADWLDKNFEKISGIWLKFAKKGSGISTVDYTQSLDVALCYGWIDGQTKRFDEKFYLQKFTPRTKKSLWSKINREKVARLIEAKKMKPSGLAAMNAAKEDGRWDDAYDSPKDMVVPNDFIKELKKDPKAYEFYLTLNKTNIYAIAWRLQTAKKPETRIARMNVIIDLLKDGKNLH